MINHLAVNLAALGVSCWLLWRLLRPRDEWPALTERERARKALERP